MTNNLFDINLNYGRQTMEYIIVFSLGVCAGAYILTHQEQAKALLIDAKNKLGEAIKRLTNK